MTFLELCQRVHRYARVGQDAPGTAPLSVIAQTGVLAEIVGWVQDAYADIQSDQDDWLFRQFEAQVAVTVDGASFVVEDVDDFEQFRPYVADSCERYILCSADPDSNIWQRVWFVPWNDWRGGRYETGGAVDAVGLPDHYTVMATGDMRFYPSPDQSMSLKFSYQRDIDVLVEDVDQPIIPVRFHDAIVWTALMAHADTRDGTSEEYQKWERRRKRAMQKLYSNQLPEIGF